MYKSACCYLMCICLKDDLVSLAVLEIKTLHNDSLFFYIMIFVQTFFYSDVNRASF